MSRVEVLTVCIPLGLFVVALCHNKLNKLVQPMRLELVEKGENFLRRSDIPETFRSLVASFLDTTFNLRPAIIFGFFAVPVIAVLFVVRQRIFRDFSSERQRMSPESRVAFEELCDLHDRITFVNHFLLFPLLMAEIAVFMMPAVLVRALLRGTIDRPGTSDLVLGTIEHWRLPHFRLPHTRVPQT